MPSLFVWLFLSSLATLAVLHIFSLVFFLYWSHSWIDIPMHFLGGVVMVFGFYAIGDLGWQFFRRNRHFIFVFSFVILVAIIWEVYEYIIRSTLLESNYPLDTATDMLMGALGAVVGYYAAKRLTYLN